MRHLLMVLALAAPGWLAAADTGISIENPWVREAPPTARMLAAYMTINNTGPVHRHLVGVESPQFTHVMLHRSEVVDGVARMIHEDDILIPEHGSVALAPGGFHLMMPAPETRLTAGDSVEFILTFANGERIKVQAEVRKKP